jgi:hypothetical protein
MSTTTTTLWAPAKVAAVSESLNTYRNALKALGAISVTGSTTRATIIVITPDGGGETFSFDIVPAQALAFFQPIVDAIAADLTAQGVDITQP